MQTNRSRVNSQLPDAVFLRTILDTLMFLAVASGTVLFALLDHYAEGMPATEVAVLQSSAENQLGFRHIGPNIGE